MISRVTTSLHLCSSFGRLLRPTLWQCLIQCLKPHESSEAGSGKGPHRSGEGSGSGTGLEPLTCFICNLNFTHPIVFTSFSACTHGSVAQQVRKCQICSGLWATHKPAIVTSEMLKGRVVAFGMSQSGQDQSGFEEVLWRVLGV